MHFTVPPQVLSLVDKEGVETIRPGEYNIQFGVEGAAEVGRVLSVLDPPCVCRLALGDNGVGDEGVAALCQGPRPPPLTASRDGMCGVPQPCEPALRVLLWVCKELFCQSWQLKPATQNRGLKTPFFPPSREVCAWERRRRACLS